jgi:hypothetical protein
MANLAQALEELQDTDEINRACAAVCCLAARRGIRHYLRKYVFKNR